jgi:hypothetical protein
MFNIQRFLDNLQLIRSSADHSRQLQALTVEETCTAIDSEMQRLMWASGGKLEPHDAYHQAIATIRGGTHLL